MTDDPRSAAPAPADADADAAPAVDTASAGTAATTGTAAAAASAGTTETTATHRFVDVPDGRLHVVEQGAGPLVLLVHGFPESWRSWRHQLPALAAAGFRAVAMDVRGYGGSLVPDDVEAYRMLAHVADAVAVVRGLGEETAVVVGHDWGSPIAAACAQLRPDVFTAVGLLGVPFAPRAPMRPTDAFALADGDEEFYVRYFQEPGRAEAEILPDVRGWLLGFYAALGGDAAGDHANVVTIPAGGRMRDRFPADGRVPAWLDPADLDAATAELEAHGVSGALNRYRNVDRDWEDLAAFDGLSIEQPAIYVAGERDSSTAWLRDAIDAHPVTLPGLHGNHLVAGAGHWVQLERPDEVNALLCDWLVAVRAGAGG
jgi:pimeloyl-ACP methyl ester carboxylesterase